MNKFSSYLTRTEAIAGWCFLPVQTLLFPPLLNFLNTLLPVPLDNAKLNFVYFCMNFLCAGVIFRRYLLQQWKKLTAAPWRVLRYAIWGFLLYYAATMLLGFVIQFIYPDFHNPNDNTVAVLVKENYTLIAIGTILLAPPVEELLYRALLFGSVRRYHRIGAYCASILVFAGIHVVSYIGTADTFSLLLSLLQYLPAGFCLCWAYEKSDSIFAPMLMHIAINQIGMSIMR